MNKIKTFLLTLAGSGLLMSANAQDVQNMKAQRKENKEVKNEKKMERKEAHGHVRKAERIQKRSAKKAGQVGRIDNK